MDRYKSELKVGEGTYGVVYKAKDKETSKTVAVKMIRLENEEEGIPSTALREISLLQELNHPYVVKLEDIVCEPEKLHLIFEYVPHDLKAYISKRMIADQMQTKQMMYQILVGLAHCHSQRVFHRDLKPNNILVTDEGRCKLADFGLARAFCVPIKTYTHEVVTLWYRAPEVLLGAKQYSLPVDLWSMGCIFYEMVHNKPFLIGDSEIDQIFKIFQHCGTPTEEEWQGVESYEYF